MKSKLHVGLLALTLLGLSAFFWSSPNEREKPTPIDGAWELVWGKYGDNVLDSGEPFQFKLFSDGYFSVIMQDENGNWTRAGAGKYELAGNVYKETFLYNSVPEYTGAYAEWNYAFEDGKLIMTGPIKVLDAAGNDASAAMGGLGHMREVRVRAK